MTGAPAFSESNTLGVSRQRQIPRSHDAFRPSMSRIVDTCAPMVTSAQ